MILRGVAFLANKNLEELLRQSEFQRMMLESARTRLEKEPLVIEYDNGGGQYGIRENPEWTAYEKLLKSYQATLRAIALQTNSKAKEKDTGIGSPLMNLRGKYSSIGAIRSA
jgi:FPC/CPF motif-containing protein YcgG